ncbi:DUF4248 domain-containing protein [Bacteroides faecis]|uniref:DUF4248 domain-containing protein n=1 Tax=Bacteroides faecis TaxID=674529 RepID=UPI0035ABFFCE
METTQEEFQVRVYLKTELAQLYAPHLNPEAALRKMRKWIHRNPELYHELYAGTEGKNELAYSKRQGGCFSEVPGYSISTSSSPCGDLHITIYAQARKSILFL